MPKIRLLHPVPVYLRKADKDFTEVMDDRLKEPIGQIRRDLKPLRLMAQVSSGTYRNVTPQSGDVTESADGYLLFLTEDLRHARVTLDIGDCVTQIGEGDNSYKTDLYFVSFKWLGHYPKAKGPTLLRAYFKDRSPSRQR